MGVNLVGGRGETAHKSKMETSDSNENIDIWASASFSAPLEPAWGHKVHRMTVRV